MLFRSRASVPTSRRISTPTACWTGSPERLVAIRPNTLASGSPWRIKRSLRRLRKDRPRPNKKAASSNEVLPAPFGPNTKLVPGPSSSSADSMQRKPSTRNSVNATRRSLPGAYRRIGITTYFASASAAAVTRQLLLASVSAMWTRSPSIADKASRI